LRFDYSDISIKSGSLAEWSSLLSVITRYIVYNPLKRLNITSLSTFFNNCHEEFVEYPGIRASGRLKAFVQASNVLPYPLQP